MLVTFKKHTVHADLILVDFGNGQTSSYEVPRKMGVPHDSIHWIVERELKLSNGFWGHAARRLTFEQIGAMAKAGGHASSTRAQAPSPQIVELVLAERIVECFEAELHHTPSSAETFRSVLEASCRGSLVDSPSLPGAAIRDVRALVADFANRWHDLPPDGALSATYHGSKMSKL